MRMTLFSATFFALSVSFSQSVASQDGTSRGDFDIYVKNESQTNIYANGGQGTFHHVDYGPEWHYTPVPHEGQLAGPLRWTGGVNGSAGYALSYSTDPEVNIVNFTFSFVSSGKCPENRLAINNTSNAGTLTCIEVVGSYLDSINVLVTQPKNGALGYVQVIFE